MDDIKIREFPEHNYRAIWFNGKTLRQAYSIDKPIQELRFPEFYDIKLTSKCFGKCEYCYQNSLPENKNTDKVLSKIKKYFEPMSSNERPFQVAIGGGECTLHPDFLEILELFYDLGICPNYTTNGMFIKDNNADLIIKETKKYCGGVAISTHPHLQKYWEPAINVFVKNKIKTNLHIIISDKDSIEEFKNIFNRYKDIVEYFVLLPYTIAGRAKEKEIDIEYFFKVINEINSKKIAYGANFYPYLKKYRHKQDLFLYEPEIMSGYLDLENMKLYKSSFNLEEK